MKKISLVIILAVMLVFAGCKKDEPTKIDCNSKLETAVKCKATLPNCDGEQFSKSVQCLGKTTTNVRCKNNTMNKCGFCYLHINQNIDNKCPLETYNACGYCDDHKDQYSE